MDKYAGIRESLMGYDKCFYRYFFFFFFLKRTRKYDRVYKKIIGEVFAMLQVSIAAT